MTGQEHWLDQYASGFHAWQHALDEKGESCFYRPLGMVERGFDLDGVGYEGRADINATLELDVFTTCTPQQIRKRILLAWTLLRLHHVLLLSKAVFRQPFMRPAHKSPTRYHLVKYPLSKQQAISEAQSCLKVIDNSHKSFDLGDFFHHAQNVARIVQPTKALAHLFVAPIDEAHPPRRIQMLMVMGVSEAASACRSTLKAEKRL